VMSSAYPVTVTPFGGGGRSEVYKLKSVGESTPPWGTPVLMSFCFEVH